MIPVISVIVPVYNTERYLDRCVQSIINQTYKNLEIILVDDGSKDGSSQRCDEYAQIDPRIRVIHKENGGQSSARNVGLDVCTGEFIGFVDSDDWIEPDMYAVLLEQLQKHNASLVVSGRTDAYENSDKQTIGKKLGKNGLFYAEQVLPQMALGRLSDFSLCDKLFHKDLWANIRLPEGEIFEDFATMYKVLIAAKQVVLYDEPFYIYFHRNNSTVTSGFREALMDYPKQTKQFLEDMTSWYPECINCAIWAHIKAIQVVMISLFGTNRETYRKYQHIYDIYVSDIRKYRNIWMHDSVFSRVDRLICHILLHRSFARMLFFLKNRLSKLVCGMKSFAVKN